MGIPFECPCLAALAYLGAIDMSKFLESATRESVTAAVVKHEAARRRGTVGPYTALELAFCGGDRRLFNAAFGKARRAITRRSQS